MSWISQAAGWVEGKLGVGDTDWNQLFKDNAKKIAANAAAAAAHKAADDLNSLGNQASAAGQTRGVSNVVNEIGGVLATPIGMGMALTVGYLIFRKKG